tara:strand:- start:4014 stop:6245 length:2232 start_codon:yes stop_codon:yes gene_type:complete
MAVTEDELRAKAAKKSGNKITHGTWNKNPGNIKGFNGSGGKNSYAKWLDKKGIKYAKGTKAHDGGYFIKFENNNDGLYAKANFWNVAKSWGAYKKGGKPMTVSEAVQKYSGAQYNDDGTQKKGTGYQQSFLNNLEENGIDLSAPIDSLSSDSLILLSNFQMQTEDPNQYRTLQKEGLITEDGQFAYEGATASTEASNTEQLTTADLKGTTGDQIIPGTGTTIDEGTSNIASLIDRNRQLTANYDFLKPGDNEALELAEKELRETMIKDHGREWKDEKGFVSPEKRGGTEGFRNQANEIVIRNLSQGLDGNTSEGAEALKRRIRGFTKLVNNKTYQKNISKAYEKQVPQTFLGSELAYIDLVSDASFNETQLVQSSGDYTFKADQIGLPHVSKRNVDDATEAAITEIAANNPAVQQRILNGEYDKVLEDYKKGIIKLVREDKSRPEDVTSASVEQVMDEAPIKKGEADHDARIKQMLEDTGSYNEDGTLITEKQADKKEAARIAKQKALQDQKDASKLKNAEMALTGLKAAAGVISLSQALKAPEVETPELSPLLLESLQKSKELAESGMTSKEKSAAMQNLSDAYAGAMKNVLRASGGQRGMFLANQGVVDANRIQGLNQLASEDAKLKRQNIKQYNALANSVGTLQMNRDMSVESMRQTTINNNRKTLSGIGGNLLSDAISDVGYYLSPNREKMMNLTNQLLDQTSGSGTKADVIDTPITTASLYANDVETDNVSTEETKPK